MKASSGTRFLPNLVYTLMHTPPPPADGQDTDNIRLLVVSLIYLQTHVWFRFRNLYEFRSPYELCLVFSAICTGGVLTQLDL
jgi:hypothetical protein